MGKICICKTLIFIGVILVSSAGIAEEPTFQSIHQEHEQLFGKPYQEKVQKGLVKITPIKKPPSIGAVSPRVDKVVFGYHPYWENGEEDQYRYDLLTHIAYHSVGIDFSNGSLTTSNFNSTVFSNMVTMGNANGVKILISATLFSSVDTFLDNATARTNSINNLLTMVQNNNADGVNIDFEHPSSTHCDKFTDYMTDLKNTFKASDSNYVIVCDVWSGNSSYFDEVALSNVCDYIFSMAYGYHWSGSGVAGGSSQLERGTLYTSNSVLDSMRDFINMGVRKEALICGLAWYGFRWPCTGPNPGDSTTGGGSSVFYTSAVGGFETYGKNWHWPSDQPYYAYYSGGQWYQTWCDDWVSWRHKMRILSEMDIGGIGMWALGYTSPTNDDNYPRPWQSIDEFYTSDGIIMLDTFEVWDGNWWDPNSSGSTSNFNSSSTFDQSSSQAHGTNSDNSAKLYYSASSLTNFMRIYYDNTYSSTNSGRGFMGKNATLSVWIYGDNSSSEFRFCLDDSTGYEVSDWFTINFSGWQKVTWDLSTDNITGWAGGNGVIDADQVDIDSLQFRAPSQLTGTIYFDDLAFVRGEQIVTAGATGDYSTIQGAIDSFGGDKNYEDNVVELQDASYSPATAITVRKQGMTTDTLIIRPASGVDPVIVLPANPGGDAVTVQADGNVIIGGDGGRTTFIPSDSGGPGLNGTLGNAGTSCFYVTEDTTKVNLWLEDVLISANNGSDVALDGKTAANVSADTLFSNDGLFVDSGYLHSGSYYGNNIFMDDVTVTAVADDGIILAGDGDLGAYIRGGSRFSYNGGLGVYAGSSRISFLGARTDQIIVNGNGQEYGGSNSNGGHGIRTMNTYDWINEIYGLAVVENKGEGLWLDSISGSADFVCEDSCFAQNGVDSVYHSNVRIDDASILDLAFTRCTFHDAVYNGDDINISATATDTSITLTDCVITGNGSTGASDTLNISSSSTNGNMTLNNCALVLQGPDALLGTYNGLYGKTSAVTQNNSYNGDPSYKSETFNNGDNADYLDIGWYYYHDRASDGGALSGYGDYVGDVVPVELSVFNME